VSSICRQAQIRRGTLVVPAVLGWIIKHDPADLTSRSLQSAPNLTSGSLRDADATIASHQRSKEEGASLPLTTAIGRQNLPATTDHVLPSVIGEPGCLSHTFQALTAERTLNRPTSSRRAAAWADSSSLLEASSSLPAADCSTTWATFCMALLTSSALVAC